MKNNTMQTRQSHSIFSNQGYQTSSKIYNKFFKLQNHPQYETIRKILFEICYSNRFDKFQYLIQSLIKFNQIMNNIHQTQNYSYQTLKSEYSEKDILQVFGNLAITILQTKTVDIPKLLRGQQEPITLSKLKIKYLLALMCFNLIPPLNTYQNQNFNKSNNFKHIFSNEKFKTKCIMEYFLNKLCQGNQQFIIQRQVQKQKIQAIIKYKRDLELIPFQLQSNGVSIQAYIGSGKVDFANKYIGGGALRTGCVQQQIMFATHPQMFVSILLCEALQDNESLVFIGFKKYHQSNGYSKSTCFKKSEIYLTYKKLKNYPKISNEIIVAIDAIDFSKKKRKRLDQFRQDFIKRQLLKAYCGFKFDSSYSKQIATGNWGCGVFKGNLGLKFMIQWLACCLSGKKMIYFPFTVQNEIRKHTNFFKMLRQIKCEQLYFMIINTGKQMNNDEQDFIQKMSGLYNSIKSNNLMSKKKMNNYKSQQINTSDVTCCGLDRCEIM